MTTTAPTTTTGAGAGAAAGAADIINDSSSGYPVLSPSMSVLAHYIVNIIHQLQDNDVWRNTINHKIKEK